MVTSAKPRIGLLPLYLNSTTTDAAGARPRRAVLRADRRRLEAAAWRCSRAGLPGAPGVPGRGGRLRAGGRGGGRHPAPGLLAVLESVDALAASPLPVILCDTTPAYGYGLSGPDELMFNHGIHGCRTCATSCCAAASPSSWRSGTGNQRRAGPRGVGRPGRRMATGCGARGPGSSGGLPRHGGLLVPLPL